MRDTRYAYRLGAAVFAIMLIPLVVIGMFICGRAAPPREEVAPPTEEVTVAPSESIESILTFEEVDIDIPFGREVYKKDYMTEGVVETVSDGKTGLAHQTWQIRWENGIEIDRILVQTKTVKQPVNEIVYKGIKPHKTGDPIIGATTITHNGKTYTYTDAGIFEGTAYMTMPPYTGTITATGTKADKGSIAVDPEVIPYGTKMFVVSCDGKIVYGEGTAEDCGPAIKNNRIDVFYHTFAECSVFARRDCFVYFLEG